LVDVGDVADYLERLAPLSLAEPWDKVGLQVGRRSSPVRRMMVCLDVGDAVISEALERDCQLIVAHHPLLFGDYTPVTEQTAAGRLLLKAVESGLAIYAAHTNLDKAPGGVNDELAGLLGLVDLEPLEKTEPLFKLVVFVPAEALDTVRQAVGDAGAGVIGRYSHCAFSAAGVGAFRPMEGARPAIGEAGRDNRVVEDRLEVEVSQVDLPPVLEALNKAHPYEEVAYDLYELTDKDRRSGIGRVGNVEADRDEESFLELCRRVINPALRAAGHAGIVRRVAVCGGSGGSLVSAASAARADLLVTGDVRHHEALSALNLGLMIVDAGHDLTEIAALRGLTQRWAGELEVEALTPRSEASMWRGGHEPNRTT
jgi:dinuclear metal center YbgI/SA1388 family protein